jgi:hypothetical protein
LFIEFKFWERTNKLDHLTEKQADFIKINKEMNKLIKENTAKEFENVSFTMAKNSKTHEKFSEEVNSKQETIFAKLQWFSDDSKKTKRTLEEHTIFMQDVLTGKTDKLTARVKDINTNIHQKVDELETFLKEKMNEFDKLFQQEKKDLDEGKKESKNVYALAIKKIKVNLHISYFHTF